MAVPEATREVTRVVAAANTAVPLLSAGAAAASTTVSLLSVPVSLSLSVSHNHKHTTSLTYSNKQSQ